MAKQNRTFSAEEKLSILQEAEREGMAQTGRKYGIANSVMHYWRSKYLAKGREGLKQNRQKVDPRVRELEEENARLKRVVARQALEIEFKDELVKKGQAHLQKGKK
jgi:transposase-like protein